VQRHPWVFSGAIERVDGDPAAGATVDVVDAAGAFLARAAYSPLSQIRARAWSFDSTQALDASFFANAIARACAARQPLLDAAHTACRLVHGESDQLPGVIADRYGDTIVVQLLSAGADTWREAIADALVAATGARCVYERSDAEVRLLEGLSPRVGVLRGTLPEIVDIVEAGIRYRVDVVGGQKTGFYLDQRDNRAIVGAHARGRRVMNAFCYTGGFTLAERAENAREGGIRYAVSSTRNLPPPRHFTGRRTRPDVLPAATTSAPRRKDARSAARPRPPRANRRPPPKRGKLPPCPICGDASSTSPSTSRCRRTSVFWF